MKDYNLKDYESVRALRIDFLADLNADFADLEIGSNAYADCEILEIERFATNPDGKEDVIVSVSCDAGIKGFCFRKAVETGRLVLLQEKRDLLDAYFERLEAALTERQAKIDKSFEEAKKKTEQEVKERAARKAAYEAKQAELKEKEKLEKKIARSQEKLAQELKAKVSIDADPIEWLRNNTISITATVPTHLEKVFTAQFPGAEYSLVDSGRKTSGGYSMKWNCSFCLTVPKDAVVPAELAQYFSGNKIRNTSLIATLVRDEGFKFGKNR